MNLQESIKIHKQLDDLTKLVANLCEDVDSIRETMVHKILDAMPEPEKRKPEAKAREVDSLEKMFVNVSRNAKMKKETK